MKASEHFTEAELACHCCGVCQVDDTLVTALDALRNAAGKPVVIDDACRCPKHNAAAGGVGHSEHLFIPGGQNTMAADLRIPGLTMEETYELALEIPAFAKGGIGAYDGDFIHVDTRPNGPARWARVLGRYCAFDTLLSFSPNDPRNLTVPPNLHVPLPPR
jgi:hypothetical protein